MENKKPLALLLTDTHLQETNRLKILQLFQFTVVLAVKYNLPVLHLGDNFESRKSQPLDNLITFQEILNMFANEKIPFYSIVGNHDKIDQSKKESYLSPFKDSPNFLLIEDFGLVPMGDVDIYFLSYFTDEKYLEHMKTVLSMISDDSQRKTLLLTHIDIKGFLMNGSNTSEHGFSDVIFGRFDKVLVGHYHDYSSNGKIEYIGASLQHNFGEQEMKGIRILYDDLSTEIVEYTTGISSYVSHYVSTAEELVTLELKNSDSKNNRVVFKGKKEDLLPLLTSKDQKIQDLLSTVKVEVKYTQEEIHSTKGEEEILTSLSDDSILLHFEKWCETESIKGDDKLFGTSLISKIKK